MNVTKKILTTELFLQRLCVRASKRAVLMHVKKIAVDRWPVNMTDAGIFWASYHGGKNAHFQISTESMLMYGCCARGSQTLFYTWNIKWNRYKAILGNCFFFSLTTCALINQFRQPYSTNSSRCFAIYRQVFLTFIASKSVKQCFTLNCVW